MVVAVVAVESVRLLTACQRVGSGAAVESVGTIMARQVIVARPSPELDARTGSPLTADRIRLDCVVPGAALDVLDIRVHVVVLGALAVIRAVVEGDRERSDAVGVVGRISSRTTLEVVGAIGVRLRRSRLEEGVAAVSA